MGNHGRCTSPDAYQLTQEHPRHMLWFGENLRSGILKNSTNTLSPFAVVWGESPLRYTASAQHWELRALWFGENLRSGILRPPTRVWRRALWFGENLRSGILRACVTRSAYGLWFGENLRSGILGVVALIQSHQLWFGENLRSGILQRTKGKTL